MQPVRRASVVTRRVPLTENVCVLYYLVGIQGLPAQPRLRLLPCP